MAAIDGLIILDSSGKTMISSNFRGHPSSYPLLHIDAYNAAVSKSRSHAVTTSSQSLTSGRKRFARGDRSQPSTSTVYPELDPILSVNVPSASSGVDPNSNFAGEEGAWMTSALCHVEREGLKFLVPISREVNPLLAFAFLDALFDTLTSYLLEITESTLRDNFDTVYMLIEEMLDEGHPMTMETNMLKEIILPPSLMRKLLTAAGVSGNVTQSTQPFIAAIPWRRPGSRYTQNEIFFDIEESIDAIVDRKGKALSSEVWGRINCNARLSGNPDLVMSFNNGKIPELCSFHPCVRYKKWEKDRTLSFIPPDGQFRLMEYQVAKPTGVDRPIAHPLTLKPAFQPTSTGGKFNLTLSCRINSRPVENIVVSIYLGQAATSVSATASGDSRPLVQGHDSSNLAGGAGGGTWEFDSNTRRLKWSIPTLTGSEKPSSLTGTWVSNDPASSPATSFQVNFEIGQYSLSGLKVEQLRVLGDTQQKPFKGIRTFVRSGKYEVRW